MGNAQAVNKKLLIYLLPRSFPILCNYYTEGNRIMLLVWLNKFYTLLIRCLIFISLPITLCYTHVEGGP